MAAERRSNRGVGRSIFTLISGAMAAQLVTVAVIPILSRLYGPNQFGEYAIFVSVTTLAAILGTFRYEMAIVLPRSAREAAAISRIGLRVLGVVASAITIVCVTIIALPIEFSPGWRWFVLLLGPGVFLLGYTSFMTQWLIRSGHYSHISRVRVLQSIFSGVGQVGLGFFIPSTGVGLALGLLIGQLAAAVFLTFARDAGAQIFANPRERRWAYLVRKYWRLPALLMPHSLVDSFRLNGVNLLIGHYSVETLGQYSQAWRLVQVPAGLIGSAISQVYFPRLAAVSRAELFQTVRGSVLRSVLLGAGPFAIIFWLSPVLFPIILGAEWAEAGRFAQALAPALYVNLAASPISTIFIVLRKEHVGLLFALIYTCFSLGALFVFSRDLLLAVWVMSTIQAVSLVGYIALALWLARRRGLTNRFADARRR